MMPFKSAVNRYDVDKSDFMHFVNSVRLHCTISMKTTRLNEDIDRAVRGVGDFRPECTKFTFAIEFLSIRKRTSRKIDGFNGLAVLFDQLENWEELVLADMLIFKISIWMRTTRNLCKFCTH